MFHDHKRENNLFHFVFEGRRGAGSCGLAWRIMMFSALRKYPGAWSKRAMANEFEEQISYSRDHILEAYPNDWLHRNSSSVFVSVLDIYWHNELSLLSLSIAETGKLNLHSLDSFVFLWQLQLLSAQGNQLKF